MTQTVTQTPEQWEESIKAIIAWIDPYINKEAEILDEREPESPHDPTSVRTVIAHMINVGQSGNEQYKNPIVHAHFLHKSKQFSRLKVSRFLAQEYQDPYMQGHPILMYYFMLENVNNLSVIESLRVYFTKFNLDAPLDRNESYSLMFAYAHKYCNDNQDIREKYQKKAKNNKNNNRTSKINTKVFLGQVNELVKIYMQCITSQKSLHDGKGLTNVTENKFVETLNVELDEQVLEFGDNEMRAMFRGIKNWSLKETKYGKKGTQIIYDNSNAGDSDNEDDLPQLKNNGGCCIIQ